MKRFLIISCIIFLIFGIKTSFSSAFSLKGIFPIFNGNVERSAQQQTLLWGIDERVTTTTEDSVLPRSAKDASGNIYFMWREGTSSLEFRKLSDIGQILIDNTTLLDISPINITSFQLFIDSSDILHVTWTTSTINDVRYGQYDSSGQEIFQPVTVRENPAASNVLYSDIVSDSTSNVHITWSEYSSSLGWRTYYKKLDSNANILLDTTEIATGLVESSQMEIDSNNHIHIAFRIDQSPYDVHYLKIDNNGEILIGPSQITFTPERKDRVSIKLDRQERLHFVWEDRNTSIPEYYIDHRIQDLNGNQIIGNHHITTTSSFSGSFLPDIDFDSLNNGHIVWHDIRDGNLEIYYAAIDDQGNLLTSDYRLTDSIFESIQPKVTVGTGNLVHVVWSDKRDGNREIYYKKGNNEITRLFGNITSIGTQIPIEDVEVTLLQGGIIIDQRLSNQSGYFSFNHLEAGTYSLAFGKNGYDSVTYSNITINDGEQVQQDVQLSQPSAQNLYIEKIEVVQSVVSDKLVSDKPTYVRVYPKVTGVEKIKDVQCVLIATKDGQAYNLSDNTISITIKTSYTEDDQIEAKDSCNFDVGELPSGNYEFIATLVAPPEISESNTTDNVFQKSVDFVTINGPKIIGVPIVYNGVAPDYEDSLSNDELVRKTYPYSSYEYIPYAGTVLNASCDPSNEECFTKKLVNDLGIILLDYNNNNPSSKADYVMGLIHEDIISHPGVSNPGINSLIVKQYDNAFLRQQLTAHELLHQYNLWLPKSQENYNQHGPYGSLINRDGGPFDAEEGRSAINNTRHWLTRNTSFGPIQRFTFMGTTKDDFDNPPYSNLFTSEDYWIDKNDYEYVFNEHYSISQNTTSYRLLLNNVIQISGIINEDNSVVLNPFHVVENNNDLSIEDPSGAYSIEFINGSTVLNSHRFSLPLSSEGGTLGLFSLNLFYPLGTNQINILSSGAIIGSHLVSQNAPSVSVVYPNGGESLNGVETIQWLASDEDNDNLTYSVYYSNNSGINWNVLASNVVNSSIDIDTDSLAGSENSLIKVEANDGINTSSDISDGAFQIQRKLPIVNIENPADSQEILTSEKIVFQGFGYDYEDLFLEDSDLTWSSDIDGVLGQGSLLKTNLSLGSHTITLIGEDSDFNQTFDQITITVISDTDADGMPNDWEITNGLNPNFDDSELDPDQDGCLNLYEYLYNTDPLVWEPYLKSISNKTVSEKGTVALRPQLLSNPENYPVTYTIDSPLFTWDGTYFKWKTSPTSSGSYLFTITAIDEIQQVDVTQVQVTVKNTCKYFNKRTWRWDCESAILQIPEVESNLR